MISVVEKIEEGQVGKMTVVGGGEIRQMEGSEVTDALQGQVGPDFSYEGEREQLQSLGREIT